MAISFGSINTGLPKDIVQQIMNAEKIPLEKMESRKAKIEEKKKLVGELIGLAEGVRGNLAKNANSRALRELKFEARSDLIGVALDKNRALPGSYQLEVMRLAQKSSAISNGFADKDKSYVGVGYVQYKLPDGTKKEIFVDPENASLSGIAKLINADTKSGMRANVINDGSDAKNPWKLVISLENTGDSNKAEFPYFYFVDGEDDFYIAEERPAQDAKIKFDGFEIEVPSNKVTDIIPGVTIDLKKAAPGEEFTLSITEDTEAVSEKVKDLVDKLNAVLKFIKQQNAIDEKTDTSRTLGGDILLQTLESRIRSVIFQDVKTSGGFKRIGDLGVTFLRDGTLSVDTKRLEAVMTEDYKTSAEILTGFFDENNQKSPGFMDNLNEAMNAVLRVPDGLLQSRNRGLQTNIEQINRRVADRQRMLEQKEKMLKDKFARLEGTMSKLKGQGAGIAALGAAGPDPVQQLG